MIYYSARVAMALTGMIPHQLIPIVGSILGASAYAIARKDRLIVKHQIAWALEMDKDSKRAQILSRAVFKHFGTSAVEICRMLRSTNKAPRIIIPTSSQAALEKAISANKGVIFVTGHLGNWELMAMALAAKGYPISTVAKKSYDPRFTAFIDKSRKRVGVDAIYRGSSGFSSKLIRALKSNKVVGFLIDQDTSVPSAFVPFFGKLAHTPLGAGTLSIKTGAIMVVGHTYRTRKGDHIIEINYIGKTNTALESASITTAILEHWIRKRPSQWVWFHKRWKTRPDREDSPSQRVAS